MISSKIILRYAFVASFVTTSVTGRDVIFEIKAAAFVPTDCIFKSIYGKVGGLYGAELTAQICEDSCWYGFCSVDYLKKDGCSIGLNTPTHVSLLPVGIGVKYMLPCCWCECVDWYVGIGFQPVHVKTIDCVANAPQNFSHWALGGVAKVGAYVDLCCDILLDLFLDYSFAKTDCKNLCQNPAAVATKADVSGVVVGAGLGYRF